MTRTATTRAAALCCALLLTCAPAWGAPRKAGDPEPAVDLLSVPSEFRKPNISSKGAGCCTFRSTEYAARWQNVPALFGMPEWMRDNGIAGGGWPAKQADVIARCAAARGMPTPRFIQYEGRDPAVIELALKTGRLPCVTWGGDHMLCCVHLDQGTAGILDNNSPGRVQWGPRDQFVRQWTAGGGGWVVVLLAPPPPPPPTNGKAKLPCGKTRCDCGCEDGEACRCAALHRRWRVFADKLCPCSALCVCGCNEGRRCPCNEPAPLIKPMRDTPDGVRWEYGGCESYQIDGAPASRQEVEEMLADDSAKLHLTLIGTPEQRREALSACGDVSRYLVQEYAPDDWALSCGHVRTARLYLQARDGRVLLRADDTIDLADRLRRADPSYNPASDPNGMTPVPSAKDLQPYLPWLAGGAAVLGVILLVRGGPGQKAAPTQPVAPRPQPVTQLHPVEQLALEIGLRQMREAAKRPPESPTPQPKETT